MSVPASSDACWAEWARPLAEALRDGPRTRSECTAIAARITGAVDRGENVVPWLELEGYARSERGSVSLTREGAAWLGVPTHSPPESSTNVSPPRRRAHSKPRAEDLRERGPFGRLVAKERAGSNRYGHAMWLCECVCGTTRLVIASNLVSGHTTSCGCSAHGAGNWKGGRAA